MEKIKRSEILSIPNILCYFRIILIPVFVLMYINAQTKEDYYRAAAIIVLSGVTDFLDGFIARKFNMITELGKAIDPLADKLTQMGIVMMMVYRFKWMWLLVIVFIIKEFCMATACFVLFKKKEKKLNGALWCGKISTATFYLVTTLLIARPTMNDALATSLIFITIGVLIYSFITYGIVFLKMYKQ